MKERHRLLWIYELNYKNKEKIRTVYTSRLVAIKFDNKFLAKQEDATI